MKYNILMKTKLGRMESQFLAYAQMRKRQIVRRGEMAGPLRLTERQERKLFSRLRCGRIIARVRRGLYLVPPRLPLGGAWTPDPDLALRTLMDDCKGRYQICGLNTFNRYGFSEQIPNRVYAYNNRLSGDRTIGAVELTLIKVADVRLGDTEEVKTSDGLTMIYSSRARTLLDAVYDWARFNTLPRAYEWIRRELAGKKILMAELVNVTLRYGDQGTVRRMGALLESEGASPALLKKLERRLRPTTSLIPWIPRRPKRGTIDRRWGLIRNKQR